MGGAVPLCGEARELIPPKCPGFHVKEDSMKVKDLMRTSVAKAPPAATVQEALSKMDSSGVTSLPVEDAEGFLLGVAKLADLSRALAEGSVAASAAVGHGLSSHLVTATPDMDVARVAEKAAQDNHPVQGGPWKGKVEAKSAAEAFCNCGKAR